MSEPVAETRRSEELQTVRPPEGVIEQNYTEALAAVVRRTHVGGDTRSVRPMNESDVERPRPAHVDGMWVVGVLSYMVEVVRRYSPVVLSADGCVSQVLAAPPADGDLVSVSGWVECAESHEPVSVLADAVPLRGKDGRTSAVRVTFRNTTNGPIELQPVVRWKFHAEGQV